MDYSRAFRKFLSGQYLSMGIILTVSVILPAAILYHEDILLQATAVPLGALCCGLTDSPGPVTHRRNTLYASLAFNFVMVLIAGYSRGSSVLITVEIAVFSMFFSLIGVYGSRINSLGLMVLLVFIFNIDKHARSQDVLKTALLFSAGGGFYVLLALLQSTLRPYKLIQQLMGECIIETSAYLQTKADFYKPNPDINALYDQLIGYQVKIHQQHNDLRELLFKTRQIVAESTRKGRILMLMFLDLIDLFERIITSQQDYLHLHQEFDDTGILEKYYKTISQLAGELHEIGLAVQIGFPSKAQHDIDAMMEHLTGAYTSLRQQNISPDTIEQYILLRQILYSIQDIAERIKRMHVYTTYDRKVSKQYKRDVDLDKFISHQELDPSIIVENLSFKSSQFRHAVRITLALLVGYAISLFYPLGHGYWILLTTITIMKPAYSITRQRNINRLFGTLAGAVIGFGVIHFVDDTTALFVIMVFAMVIAYSFLRLNYFIGVAGVTIYVLISLSFLSPGSIKVSLQDRLVDTLIGSALAYLSAFVLPAWEHLQISEYIKDALAANSTYFKAVAANFLGKKTPVEEFKLARKDAFVKLANLSDNFQRMISEPKTKQPKLDLYHQFVVTTHTLTSYIASLSYYAQRTNQEYASREFQPLIEEINEHFTNATAIMEEHKALLLDNAEHNLAINNRVQNLLKQRKKELMAGTGGESIMSVRTTLSDLKTITDQFHMISDITTEQAKILVKVYSDGQEVTGQSVSKESRG